MSASVSDQSLKEILARHFEKRGLHGLAAPLRKDQPVTDEADLAQLEAMRVIYEMGRAAIQ